MKVVDSRDGKNYSIETKELSFDTVSVLNNENTKKILNELKEPKYPKQLAKNLNLHEQNVYYYIRKLEKAGIIEVVKQENINGTIANYYKISSSSFFFKVDSFKESSKVYERSSTYLSPFISNGQLDALIVVGSPDPHGPLKARSRDGYFGMDLALFLGSFLNYIPESRVKLDTEVTDKDLKENNLIVIGGPIVNKVTSLIGNRTPIYFDEEKKGVTSKVSKKTYVEEEVGFINKCESPFNKNKHLLQIVGLRNYGTKAAILAFLKKFSELKQGNIYDRKVSSRIVEGLDLDSDGIVDNIEFLE